MINRSTLKPARAINKIAESHYPDPQQGCHRLACVKVLVAVRRSGSLIVDSASKGLGLDVPQQVQKVVVGGRLRHRLEYVGLVVQDDHTPVVTARSMYVS